MPKPARTLAGYRQYSESAVDRVRLVRITESVEHEADSLTYLGDNGLTPGTTALVQSRAPDGTLTLVMGDAAIALGPAMTERMFIAAV